MGKALVLISVISGEAHGDKLRPFGGWVLAANGGGAGRFPGSGVAGAFAAKDPPCWYSEAPV